MENCMTLTKGTVKRVAHLLILLMAVEIGLPTVSYALTSGPSQPEVQSFEPVSTTQMVDPFTGDFTYNIPLLDVGGYPINIAYHSGVKMDDEASWVGLGWNINPGSLVRNLRGLPDDFNGEEITFKRKLKPVKSFAISKKFDFQFEGEMVGLPKLKKDQSIKDYIEKNKDKILTRHQQEKYVKGEEHKFLNRHKVIFSVTLNNYKGVGYSLGGSVPIGNIGMSQLSFGSQEGLGLNGKVFLAEQFNLKQELDVHWKSLSLGVGRSRAGTSYSIGYSSQREKARIKNVEISKNLIPGGTSFYPSASMSFTNTSFSASVRFGKEYLGLTTYKGPWGIHYSEQSMMQSEDNKNVKGFGYLYLENGETDRTTIMDVNRSNDVSYNRKTKFLPIAQLTHDPLIATGQGIGGIFTPRKSSLGKTWTNYAKSGGDAGFDLSGIDLGGAQSMKIGGDAEISYGNSEKSSWDATEFENYSFRKSDNIFSEPFYYKALSDFSLADHNYFQDLKWESLLTPKVGFLDGNFEPNEQVVRENREKRSTNLMVKDIELAEKMGLSQDLVSHEYNMTYGLTQFDYAFKPDKSGTKTHTILERDYYNPQKKEQMSEISITQADGSTYVYGLPLVNHRHIETTFALGSNQDPPAISEDGLIAYADNDTKALYESGQGNEKGIDNYVERKEIPAYAHAFMLTAVLSSDYVDITGDGPTEDDLGNYTKFNYARTTPNYKWRFPISKNENQANHDFGLLSSNMDDKGSYTYGEKDVWQVYSIETKTHMALFYLGNRIDGFGAKGEKGGIETQTANPGLKKLDKIELYSKEELKRHGESTTPLKTVHFEYSYDLCPNTPNNYYEVNQIPAGSQASKYVDNSSGVRVDHPLEQYNSAEYNRAVNEKKGKLTLHKIYFTYGKNQIGRQSPYIFEYKGSNPAYAYNSADRWGTYKENKTDQPNNFFPYTRQDRSEADITASAWHLTDIRLPSGGTIHVDYEADDYAYVQNKKAMYMQTVGKLGRWDETLGRPSLNEDNNKLYKNGIPNRFIMFTMDPKYDIDDYLGDLETIYFRFKIDLGSDIVPLSGSQRQLEFIPGFAKLAEDLILDNNEVLPSKGSFINSNDEKIGYVRIESVEIPESGAAFSDKLKSIYKKQVFNLVKNSNSVPPDFGNVEDLEDIPNIINPISQISWQFTRRNTPWIAYPGSDYKNSSLSSGTKAASVLLAAVPEAMNQLMGYQMSMLLEGKSQFVDLDHSMIRLQVPSGSKIGGGSRVSKVMISDNWNSMSNEPNHYYGQKYTYTTTEDGREISSGVASWEPIIGGEENPHRTPVFRKEKGIWQPSNVLYDVNPIAEALYPSASAGYSHIKVENLDPDDLPNGGPVYLGNRKAGYTIQEFYTAKDFPTISRSSTLERNKIGTIPLKILIGVKTEIARASQGFSIELNDMHGKFKAIKSYSNKGKLVSETRHFYQQEDKQSKVPELNNDVLVLNKDGSVSESKMGIDIETLLDPRSLKDVHGSFKLSANVDAFMPGILIPSLFPDFKTHLGLGGASLKSVKTATITKVITKKGLLKRIKVYQDGSTLESENLAYDAETGGVLLSRSENEFGKYTYNLNLPAHWAYEGMGASSKNVLLKVFNMNVSDGKEARCGNSMFFKGDQVLVYDRNNSTYLSDRYWVLDVTDTETSFIDRQGNKLADGSYNMLIIQAGRKNLLGSSMGTLVLQENPIIGSQGNRTWTNFDHSNQGSLSEKVLAASAIEYTDTKDQYPFTERGDIINSCELDPSGNPIYPLLSGMNVPEANTSDLHHFYEDKKVNPYVSGIWGSWSPLRSYAFNNKLKNRRQVNQDIVSSTGNFNFTDISTDGAYKEFDFFWSYNSNTDTWEPGAADNSDNSNKWTWMELTSVLDPNGFGLESQNALGINSSALYGYDRLLPIAVASNSKTNQMVFDGFEDYGESGTLYSCDNGMPMDFSQLTTMLGKSHHWFIWRNFVPNICEVSDDYAHTGKYSLKVIDSDVKVEMEPLSNTTPNAGSPLSTYHVQKEDLVPWLCPTSGKYYFSYWYKPSIKDQKPIVTWEYQDASGAHNMPLTNEHRSIEINGWIRYEAYLTIPAGVQVESVKMVMTNSENKPAGPAFQDPVYVDDIRLHPAEGEMKSFVYDAMNNRLMATLDQNNYATFYEYDEEGKLVRMKVETERGVSTLKETRSNTVTINH